ncbi:hypothetical protein [Vulgatibacter incomptus]|nr:hypothetical protein [Vulgatibacter incomptus]
MEGREFNPFMSVAPGWAALAILLVLAPFGCRVEAPPSLPGLGDACDPRLPDTCVGSFCLPLDGSGICSRACDDFDSECPSGMTCQVDAEQGAFVCKPGFRCSSDESCPSGHRCDTDRRICFIPVQRGLCAPCTADAQCPAGGVCFRAKSTGERFCTSPCGPDVACPDGYRCIGDQGKGQCVPRAETCYAGKPLCAPCRGDVECGSGNARCVNNVLTGERFCGQGCNPSCVWDEARRETVDRETRQPCRSGCPQNFSCTQTGGANDPYQCVPNSNTCIGYCVGGSAAREIAECGPGYECDPRNNTCVPASDGRACAPCTDDDKCNPPGNEHGASCISSGSTSSAFCAPPCMTDADCANALGIGFACMEVEGKRMCAPLRGSCKRGLKRLGEDCSKNGEADCIAGVCLRYGDLGICSGPCRADADCGDSRYQCCPTTPDGTSYDCRASTSEEQGGVCVPRGGTFGDDCEPGRPPCRDGYCLDIGTARLCTAACGRAEDCDFASGTSGAFWCQDAEMVDENGEREGQVKVCFPRGGGELGSDCSFGPAACVGGYCIKKRSGNVCTQACSDKEAPCPEGWACEPHQTVNGKELNVCVPG